MSRWLTGWRLALRIAAREARRARGRTALVLVMISLPVLAVVTTAVVNATADVSFEEGLDRKLGTEAAALVTTRDGLTDVRQGADPTIGSWTEDGTGGRTTAAQVRAVLGDRPMTPVRLELYVPARTDAGVDGAVRAVEVDPASPLAAGLSRLTEGRWPRTTDEVVVNSYLASRGPGLGEQLALPPERRGDPDRTLKVVGIAEDADARNSAAALGLPGAFAREDDDSTSWLVGGGPVGWDDVVELNAHGAFVLSRAVALDPPPQARAMESEVGSDDGMMTVVVLVVVMALIEVVLLAGPAFAVGARRQSRSLALIAASGGTPPQSRRVILASGIVLGLAGSAIGVIGGIALGRVLGPVVQRFSGDWLGPFEIPWLQVAGVAAFGLVSALLAAVVPAWISSRQDVVAVLSGRRGDGRPSVRSPLLGLVLLGAGVAGAVLSTRRATGGETYIAGAAILCVLGMVLLVPVVVATVARLSGRMPLALRFAARDAARHRTRTAPAVAAVAATVAGVVALGIATSSDELQNRETYVPALAMGQGMVTGGELTEEEWATVGTTIGEHLPDVAATVVPGVGWSTGEGDSVNVVFRADGEEQMPLSWGGLASAAVLVSEDGRLPAYLTSHADAMAGVDVSAVERTLDGGGAVVFTGGRPGAAEVRAEVVVYDPDGAEVERRAATAPVTWVQVEESVVAPTQAVISPQLAQQLRLDVSTVGVLLDGRIPEAAEADLGEALQAIGDTEFGAASLYVERGYEAESYAVVVQLVLGALGAVLMLGGTLTATFLALADARPDLATLAAVGASPRTRRGVAAAYALVVGVVGAALGALVGMVPGVAVTWPLTTHSGSGETGPFIDIPWLLIGSIVLGLPLLVAAVVGLCTRSRLPMVARAD